jgi:hypothetical protein
MLTGIDLRRPRTPRPPPSLRQQYHQHILQRIEAFKNSLTREELLGIGDEAVAELDATIEGQFVLTEVLMQETVDRLIAKRLRLKPYRRWVQHFRELRAAQQAPTHWGIDLKSPITKLLSRLEPGDRALVIGAGVEAFAYLLAAHEMDVTFLASDLACVERVESRVAAESLGSSFLALVAQIGSWLPELPGPAHLVVMDAGALEQLGIAARRRVLGMLQDRTHQGGAHLIVPSEHALAPEAFLSSYQAWERPEHSRSPRRKDGTSHSRGIILVKPCHSDASNTESEQHMRARTQ